MNRGGPLQSRTVREPPSKDGSHLGGRVISMAEVAPLLERIERKDMTTAAHTWRVTLYTRRVAEELGLTRDFIERVCHAAALHDIGKLSIPDAMLQKPGPLTEEEFRVIQTHTTLGYDFLRARGVDDQIVLGLVRHHHERLDGTGYPDGLAGEALAMGPRYFAVIDSFDAMTSVRPYRSDLGPAAADRALEELAAGAGTRYDPDAVEMFTRLHATGQLDWIRRHFNDQCPVPGVADLGRIDAIDGR